MKSARNPAKSRPQSASVPLRSAAADDRDAVATVSFPIVGIGASAGGLAAFEAFFSGMPTDVDPGMAFVLVQHLAPDHKSILADLIRRYTRMQVFEVADGMPVQANCAYIIPPNRQMALLNGRLELLEPSEPRGQRLPIDFFFRSLAADQHEKAIAIVLSGTGSDGTLGVRAIKGEGGMVMSQIPESTEFDGMPRSAIATGLVDCQLPPAEMPAQLIAYAAHAFGKRGRPAAVLQPQIEGALSKIFVLLRTHTGHDFLHYKPSSTHRRILRRMSVHQIDELDDYLRFLQQSVPEVEALFRDLLIGVTGFFRDPEAFQTLEQQLVPALFANRPAGSVVRVWSVGCSSGEEAYSIAILLEECMEALKQRYTVQVFATDIDNRAITIARAGLYPASVAADISPPRLARFFTAESGGGYRIHKRIRDMLVFSEQDVVRDPPFSRLDLISCRNLLIYLGAEAQKRLIPLFHYALNPHGVLFLGGSESIGDSFSLFAVVDRKAKLFQRKEDVAGRYPALNRELPRRTALPRGGAASAMPVKLPVRELTEQELLRQLAPAAALVDEHGDILYLHGRTGAYLEPAPGEAGVNNILTMAREGLRLELSAALHKAAGSKSTVRVSGLRVRTNGHFVPVTLAIHPLKANAAAPPTSPLYLVILEEAHDPDRLATQAAAPLADGGSDVDSVASASGADARLAAVIEELRARDEYLQSTHEELETANEELKSSNEEMQSVNEELQSTNEELETSKEELQSVNEELATVNSELQTKVVDLSRANNDMNNLLAGTGIATVFVDHRLRILRFTPAASQIIHLILSDVGRPVGHLVTNLIGYDEQLVSDLQAVLDTLEPKEAQVQSKSGAWYMMRIRPYRTLDNVIEGATISFVDITELKRTEEALASANKLLRLTVVVRDAFDAITLQDPDGRILAWNPAAVRMYGWSEAEALQMNVRERIPASLRDDALSRIDRLDGAEILEPHRTQRICKDGTVLDVWVSATALVNGAGEMYAIATTERAQQATAARQAAGDSIEPAG
ncbi:MAG: PAS domain-containing protein [Rhodobacteraceae bacterium]|nr:PAS domain-containing protein [Paracoccaceae bacterium]